ncbi:hypothetical protein I601_0118 [Nocardioides dokdonensis FR1436]|uniref:Sulfotransferase family protein n=1 Tax=Nocardioides dokdonensis FR1436 TaxID=1300347 RepID=A0A1A9GG02_9ACTN|nr:hypothetical protein [Nocardioides dokdonensis]ANH36572.1 hypothetical protein I601_0118 [Nocardioides dokdonensis FR1436]
MSTVRSAPRRVFLHVGLPKTGTTYLQDALWGNRALLRRRGLLLPGARRRHLLASLDVREDPGLARRPGDTAHPWRDLVEEALAWPGDVLISHEFFAAASVEQVHRVVADLPDTEVHVLVTARAMPDLFISRWQEWVKNGARGRIDAYPPDGARADTGEWGWPSFDLAIVLERWGAVLPHDRVHVLPMAPGRSEPAELLRRFLGVLGQGDEGLEVPESAANASLGLVEVELLRRVNKHLDDFRSAVDRGTWIRGYLGEGGVLPSSREKFRPSQETLADLVARGERASAMLRDGGFDVVGDLDLLAPGELSGRRHPDEVDDGEMLAAASVAIARLTSDVRSLTRERDALVRVPSRPRRWSLSRVTFPRRTPRPG